MHRDGPAGRIDAADPFEVQRVLQAVAEDALAAVPVAVEDDGVTLLDMEPSVSVEMSGHRQPAPSQRARIGSSVCGGEDDKGEEKLGLHGGSVKERRQPGGGTAGNLPAGGSPRAGSRRSYAFCTLS